MPLPSWAGAVRRGVSAPLLYGVSISLGALVLVGWVVGSDNLTRVLPSLVAMQPATAVDFVLLGLAGLLAGRGTWGRWSATAMAATVVVIAGTGLVTELIARPYPFEVLGYAEQNQGRMSGITAVAHVVLGSAMIAIAWGRRRRGHVLGFVAAVVGLIAISGYAYGTSDLYDVGYFQTLALHTAVGILILGAAVVISTREIGLAGLVTSNTVGGSLVRHALPVVVLTPTVLGWMTLWSITGGFISPGFAFALYATVVALTSGVVVWRTGVRLSALDLRRVTVEDAYAERDALATQLAAANQELRDFTAAAAHDLRGPLSAAALGAGMLRDLEDEGSRRRAIDGIERSMRRGMALVEDLLEYSNVGVMPTQPTRLDLERAVQRARMDAAQATGRSIVLDIGPLPPVMADAGLVARLLANLVDNATKYTPAEAETVDLLVTSRRLPGPWVEISVADRGKPIPVGERTRIFDIFQRGSGTGEVGGSGVGLAICRRVVERHGGRIWVDDLAGWSKRFVFTLPGCQDDPPEERTDEDVPPRRDPSPASRHGRGRSALSDA